MGVGAIGTALCVLAGLCMVAGLAVDLDSTAAKALILASAILFVPGVILTFVWMRIRVGTASVIRAGWLLPVLATLVLAGGADAAGRLVVVSTQGTTRARTLPPSRSDRALPRARSRTAEARTAS